MVFLHLKIVSKWRIYTSMRVFFKICFCKLTIIVFLTLEYLNIFSTRRIYSSVQVDEKYVFFTWKCFLPDEYTSLCKLMKMVMNSTSNLHVSSLGGVMRNYKMSSLHGSTSSQKSSWRAWECVQQGRKTIVQDLVVSWNTLVSCTVVFPSCCVHSQACQLDFRRFVLIWKEDTLKFLITPPLSSSRSAIVMWRLEVTFMSSRLGWKPSFSNFLQSTVFKRLSQILTCKHLQGCN